MERQIDPICATVMPPGADLETVRNGGSARGYLGRWRGLSVPYGLLNGRPFCIIMHRHPRGEYPHLPQVVRAWRRAAAVVVPCGSVGW